jgi:hypothetical protein
MIAHKEYSWFTNRRTCQPRTKPRRKGWWRLIAWTAVPVALSLLLALIGSVELLTAGMLAAIYKQSAANSNRGSYAEDYWIAGCALTAAAFLTFFALLRFFRLFHIVRHGKVIGPLALTNAEKTMPWRIRLNTNVNDRTIEWQLMRFPRNPWGKWPTNYKKAIQEPLTIRGSLESGRWLIVQTSDSQLLWPATRSQLVIGTTAHTIPLFSDTSSEIISSHHRLLATYAHTLDDLKNLPVIIRYPLDRATQSWWWLGAPRFLVEWITSQHIRRSMNAMRSALFRMALLTDISDGGAYRDGLRKVGKECQELIDTCPGLLNLLY